MKTQKERLAHLIEKKEIFFIFMNEKYPVFFNSNIFLRDIQYAIRTYFERKDIIISYAEAEELMEQFTGTLERSADLIRLTNNSWKVNFSVTKSVIIGKAV